MTEGRMENQLDADELRTYSPGYVWYEPAMYVNRLLPNLSNTETAKIRIFQVLCRHSACSARKLVTVQVRFAVLLLAMLGALPALAQPPLWAVKSGKSEVFLFGQMGVKANTRWQSAKIWKAFANSTVLWTENPQEHRNPDPNLIKELSRDARPLSELLSDGDLTRLRAALKTAGIPSNVVNSMNAYVVLESTLEKEADIDAANLPERVFAKRAAESGKPIHSEFDSVDAQLRFTAATYATQTSRARVRAQLRTGILVTLPLLCDYK
jgi:TraB/PrgY/gumN family